MKIRTIMRVFSLLLMAFGVLATAALQSHAAEPTAAKTPSTMLVTGYSLMPGWGLYPQNAHYGGTQPSDGASAWGNGQLTWVAEFAESGTYHAWARLNIASGSSVRFTVDERPVTDGRGGGSGNGYAWRHLGVTDIQAGTRHVDIFVSGMFDALLLTRDPAYHPDNCPLPEPVKNPRIRAPRRYRDDAPLRAAAGRLGFVVSRASLYDVSHVNDVVPAAEDRIEQLDLWGAPGEYVAGTFHVRALESAAQLKVSLTEVTGPTGARIEPDRIDVRVVQLRERWVTQFSEATEPQHREAIPELLVRDDRTGTPPAGHQGGYGGTSAVTSIPAHESRQFWITLDLASDLPPGRYQGVVRIEVENAQSRALSLPVTLDVVAVPLEPVQGFYALYHPNQSTAPDLSGYVSAERYRAELQDMVRHGCNAATLYGGVSTLEMARQAGLTEAPIIMGWGNDPAAEVAQAKTLGFPDLYHYGVDEPQTPEEIERIVTEAKRRLGTGYHHMVAAINSNHAYEATRDVVDRPVFNSLQSGGKDNPRVKYALDKGFIPISYWMTRASFPLYYRGMVGLWNTACGYRGTIPWSYRDSGDGDLHAVVYPDEAGNPIPTLRWEAFREGIDDVRYLQALDRAIAAATERMAAVPDDADRESLERALARARDVRGTRYESLGGAWYSHLSAGLDEALDAGRREMADAVLALRHALAATAQEADR